MKNDLLHLNDILHQALDTLIEDTDHEGEPLDADAVRLRIQRAGAISGVAQQIIGVGRLALDVEQLRAQDTGGRGAVPAMLRLGKDEDR